VLKYIGFLVMYSDRYHLTYLDLHEGMSIKYSACQFYYVGNVQGTQCVHVHVCRHNMNDVWSCGSTRYNYLIYTTSGGRWEDNIKMDLREIGIDGANWIQLAQDRVQWRAFVNTVMNLQVP